MNKMPSRKDLAEATLTVLEKSNRELKAATINELVAAKLSISADILAIEDANCTGTEYAYQMRWIRTDLKKKGLIVSPERSFWKLA